MQPDLFKEVELVDEEHDHKKHQRGVDIAVVEFA
jgi:hypothetical protein